MGMKARLRELLRFARCAWRPRVLVLVYHCVSPPGCTDPHITVSPERFEQQMAFLSRSGLAVSMDEFLGYLRGAPVPRGGRVLVTMDDADEGTGTHAAPVLRRYGVPATVFVPTGAIGKSVGFWWHRFAFLAEALRVRGGDLHGWLARQRSELADPDPTRNMWKRFRLLSESDRDDLLDRAAREHETPALPQVSRPMNWDELAELTSDGLITLGAHTVSHPMLAQLTDAELAWEVRQSRKELATRPGYRDVFAYPYGDAAVVTPQTIAAVRDAEFTAAFVNSPGTANGASDPLTIPRVGIDDMDAVAFRWLVDRGLSLTPAKGE